MDLDLRHLESFVAVAEDRHFRLAAQRLHITQPALTRQIRKLEEGLGTQLVDRSSRPVRLTPAGKAFLEEAQLAVHHARRSVEQARRTARGEVGEISVGATFWADTAIFPSALRAFRARAPHVTVDLATIPPIQQVDELQKEQLDIGVTAFTPWLTEGRALEVEPLLEEPMVAIVAEDHFLAAQAHISLEELAREPFVSLPQMTVPGLVFNQSAIFHERGLTPRSVQEVPDLMAMFSLIGAGAGVGLHMASCSNLRRAGVVFVPLADDPPTATLLSLRRADDHREVVRTFLDCAREVAHALDPPPVTLGERATARQPPTTVGAA